MNSLLRPCLGVFTVLTLVTGVAYPVLVTTVARLAFPAEAGGSLIERDGRAVGSSLLGQPFSSPGYFWSRPSATAPQPYNGASSAGSNLAATNPALADAVAERVRALRAADPGNDGAGARRPRHGLRQRPRSAHLARRCASTRSRAWPGLAASRPSGCARSCPPTRRAACSVCSANRA